MSATSAFMEAVNSVNTNGVVPDVETEEPLATEEQPAATEPTVTPAAAPTPAVEPASSAPQGPRTVSLDDLTPDLPDLPPTRRGAPFRLLLDDRRDAIQQAINAGNEKNAMAARLAVTEKALEVLTRRMEPPPLPVAPLVPETSIDAVRRKVDPATFQYDPEGVLGAAVDVADERALGHVTEADKKLRADLEAQRVELDRRVAVIEEREAGQRTYNAYRVAFPDRNPNTDPDLNNISFYIDSMNNSAKEAGQPLPLPVDNPESYRIAAAWLDRIAAQRVPTPPPPPVPVIAPVVASPPAPPPAPPVGSGAPVAAAPPADVASLAQHDRAAFEGLLSVFPQLAGKPDIANEIIQEVAADAAANRSPYSRRNVKRSATA